VLVGDAEPILGLLPQFRGYLGGVQGVASPLATSVHRPPGARPVLPSPEPEREPAAWIWRIDLADDRRQEFVAEMHLSESERRRARRGTGAVRRRRILLRAGLRQALGGLLDLPPAEVPLVEDDGRPRVGGDRDLHVSCSASGRVGVVAIVAGSEVGIDVQTVEEDPRAALTEGWLAPDEESGLRRLRSTDRATAVTRCWTQKEAVLKGLGLGLRQRPATVVTPMAEAGRVGEWVIRPVPVPPGHVASVAIRTRLDEIGLVIRDMTVGEIR
jgi:4'-phosphopantetheinyl transferase